MAVGMLGMLSVVLAVSLGIIQANERTLFTAVLLVVFAVVALTLLSLAYEEHEPDECIFDGEHA
jgi:4-amino-4-deoxy-L-arabinose transferase-like glycosyltransferase